MKNFIYSIGMVGILLSITGCATLKVAMGVKYDDPAEDLADNHKEITEMKTPYHGIVVSKDKAYLLYWHRKQADFKGLFEVINNKIEMVYYIDASSNYSISGITGERRYDSRSDFYYLVNGMGREDGFYAIELTPGKHKFIQGTSCSPFTAEIDMKAGNVYDLRYMNARGGTEVGSCTTPYYFAINKIDNVKRYANSMTYNIKPESKKIINKAIADSTLPEKYILFMKNIDNIPNRLSYVYKEGRYY